MTNTYPISSPVRTETSDTRLVWLLGDEEVVCAPSLVEDWPDLENLEPFYSNNPKSESPVWLTFPSGLRGVLNRYHTTDLPGRILASFRERPWRSPAATAARNIFHLQCHGIETPRLLAFGQRLNPLGQSESFLVVERPGEIVPLQERLHDPFLDGADRRLILRECGHLLRQLHDVKCTLLDPHMAMSVSMVPPLQLCVSCVDAVKKVKRLKERNRRTELRDFVAGLPVGERAWILRGYLGPKWANRDDRRSWLASIL